MATPEQTTPISSEGMKHAADVNPMKLNPRVKKAENAVKDAGVETPWQNSHQSTKPGSSTPWHAHSANSQGLSGQTTWEHKGAKRGGDKGPEQRNNPWTTVNTKDGTDQSQGYL